jgi:hypothetical protein
MRFASWIVAALCSAVSGLLLLWGGWLLVTDDPDGGRHPVGAVMLVVAVLSGILALTAVWRSRQR